MRLRLAELLTHTLTGRVPAATLPGVDERGNFISTAGQAVVKPPTSPTSSTASAERSLELYLRYTFTFSRLGNSDLLVRQRKS